MYPQVERALSHVEMKNKEAAYQAWLGYYNSNKTVGRGISVRGSVSTNVDHVEDLQIQGARRTELEGRTPSHPLASRQVPRSRCLVATMEAIVR